MRTLSMVLLLVPVLASATPALAQSLRGSSGSLDRQARQARLHDFTYVRRPNQVDRLVTAGALVPIEGNRHYRLDGVSFEVGRPEVRRFVERLAVQYHRACGEPLVVTSLTRPTSLQPENASPRSVHPTGMAIDFRRPSNSRCRSWLETTLLSLERRRVLEATRETSPPHYHVALFPAEYAAYLAGRKTGSTGSTGSAGSAGPTGSAGSVGPTGSAGSAGPRAMTHIVQPQETLWRISQQYGTTVAALQAANRLTGTAIRTGQRLRIPTADLQP